MKQLMNWVMQTEQQTARIFGRKCFSALMSCFLGLCVSQVQAVQQTFWPSNQWPVSGWSFSPTNFSAVQFTVGTIPVYLSGFTMVNSNAVTLPALGASITFSNNSEFFTNDLSISSPSTPFPATGTGIFSATITHTNDIGSSRYFSVTVNRLYTSTTSPDGPFFLQVNSLLSSGGQAIITATNGGFLISTFINLQLQISTDGVNWINANTNAYDELSGTPGLPAPVPTVQFTATPTNGLTPLTVQFNCPALDSGGNTINFWSWNFGDGFASTNQNPLHIYNSAGNFSPSLVATNDLLSTVLASGPLITLSSSLPPALGISSYSNQPAVFFPNASGTNFVLQMTTNLAKGPWVTVSNGIAISGVIVTNLPANGFFRLANP